MAEEANTKELSEYAEVKLKEKPEDFIQTEQITIFKVTHPKANSWEQAIEYRDYRDAVAIANRAITRKAREANKKARAHKLFEIPKVKISTTHTMTVGKDSSRRFGLTGSRDDDFELGDHQDNLPFTFYAVKTGKHMQSLYDRIGSYKYVYQDSRDIGTLINDSKNDKLVIRTDDTQGYKHNKTVIVAIELDSSSDNKLLRADYRNYYRRELSVRTLLVPLTFKNSCRLLTETGFINQAVDNFKQLLNLDYVHMQYGRYSSSNGSTVKSKLVTNTLMLGLSYNHVIHNSNIVLPEASEKLLRIWLKKAYKFLKAPTPKAKKVDKDEEVV